MLKIRWISAHYSISRRWCFKILRMRPLRWALDLRQGIPYQNRGSLPMAAVGIVNSLRIPIHSDSGWKAVFYRKEKYRRRNWGHHCKAILQIPPPAFDDTTGRSADVCMKTPAKNHVHTLHTWAWQSRYAEYRNPDIDKWPAPHMAKKTRTALKTIRHRPVQESLNGLQRTGNFTHT